MNHAHIPQTYEEWRHCITVICRQPLTMPYLEARIAALNTGSDPMTARFVELYGEAQRLNAITWFKEGRHDF
ncbi:hypothetical protein [uncultured Aquitalea sp.]|uniref:hypothetical protein n=1 Tax=uncultured Aquitalea sp. TaxID=540272 RepID=UPI0025F1B677|nr:hypothetical protein [uncultured Aquitalea sp.]